MYHSSAAAGRPPADAFTASRRRCRYCRRCRKSDRNIDGIMPGIGRLPARGCGSNWKYSPTPLQSYKKSSTITNPPPGNRPRRYAALGSAFGTTPSVRRRSPSGVTAGLGFGQRAPLGDRRGTVASASERCFRYDADLRAASLLAWGSVNGRRSEIGAVLWPVLRNAAFGRTPISERRRGWLGTDYRGAARRSARYQDRGFGGPLRLDFLMYLEHLLRMINMNILIIHRN